jgi:hypothetical protein
VYSCKGIVYKFVRVRIRVRVRVKVTWVDSCGGIVHTSIGWSPHERHVSDVDLREREREGGRVRE